MLDFDFLVQVMTQLLQLCDENDCTVHVSGYWLVLDFDFLVQVMTHLLQLCDENDWTVHVSGYWRVLDFDFLVQVMTHLLQLCDENDWTNTGIPLEESCNVLHDQGLTCLLFWQEFYEFQPWPRVY